ncbi:MAG: prohibitin family protein [Acidobacteria bacterium]|nr:prohibitin family protein [Acidobacteriota bacterium]MBI3424494.1 prohibitin family protein [Acidobacteriota bacterium]
MSANFSNFENFGKQAHLGGGGLRKLVYLVLGFFLLIVFFSTFKTVPAGYRAVVFNNITGGLGARGEGLTLLIPFTQTATLYDVRTSTYTMSRMTNEGQVRGDDSVQALTSDGQEVAVDVSILYHPDPTKIVLLHREIGPDYEAKIVRPSGRSVTRTSVSKYAVIDVYGAKRSEIQNEVQTELKVLFDKSYLILDSLLVRNVDFSPEFKKAIELKQIAQQESERKKYELEKEKIEKERKIVAAEGDAEAIKLRGDALSRNPALIQYEYVQKITPGVQTIITDGKSILSLGDIVRGNGGKGK